ncbi:hypothetical protein ACFSFZ_01005 [Mixta tenebrionis]|nr:MULTISPECIES: hypothetical protein [Mixta]
MLILNVRDGGVSAMLNCRFARDRTEGNQRENLRWRAGLNDTGGVLA